MLQTIAYRLPTGDLPRAVVETDYSWSSARLLVDGVPVLAPGSRSALEAGAVTVYRGLELALQLSGGELDLTYDGHPAIREDRMGARTARAAWLHGYVALAASFFGFVASYLYLERARALDDAWSLKMAIHMAGWHLLLTLTLFPASVWGQRPGIRAVQGMSLLFFFIHVGIALANTVPASAELPIAILNAASGLCFAAAVLYGQIAHKAMDPLRELGDQPLSR